MIIDQYLEDLENRLHPAVENQLEEEWRQFFDGRFTGRIFSPRRTIASPALLEWPSVPINTALDDYESMLLRELKSVSDALASGSGILPNIRCNYGIGILPSVFGCEPFYMAEELDTLPTALALPGGAGAIEHAVQAGVPELDHGLAPKVFECARYFRKKLAPYPKLHEYIRIYHPDLQGPIDVCEVVWGSEMLLAFYDVPELLAEFLTLITDTYLRFMGNWNRENPLPAGHIVSHWGLGQRGAIMLRNDSAMNLSGEMYEEFVMPHDQRLLAGLGGGAVHFCGHGDHYIDRLARMDGITGVQLTQPEHNDMECIFRHTVDKGIPLLGLPARGAESDRDFHGLVHVS